MKRLLVLSYYFPPLGMSGVQRTLKFVKYLPEFGWQPVVLTIRARGSYGYDPQLLEEIPGTEILRTHSLDPLYLSPTGHRPAAAGRRGLISRLNRFMVPDNKRGWVPFAVRRGLAAAKTRSFDAIFSTAPPFSSHLAALALKHRLGRPLLCDFRDAWTGNPLASYASPLHRMYDRRLEARVLDGADHIVAVNREVIETFEASQRGPDRDRFSVLPQGYDPADFPDTSPEPHDGFIIVYTGTFVERRTPQPLLSALALIRGSDPDIFGRIRVIFAGSYRPADRDLVRSAGMEQTVDFRGYLPHRESLALLKRADLLWLVIDLAEGRTVATGKIYEFLGAGRPILASAPEDGAAAALLAETGAGRAVSRPADLARAILEVYRRRSPAPRADTARYDRRLIAGQLAEKLDRLAAP